MKRPTSFTDHDAKEMYNFLRESGTPQNEIPKTFGDLWDASRSKGFQPTDEWVRFYSSKPNRSNEFLWDLVVTLFVVLALILIFKFS